MARYVAEDSRRGDRGEKRKGKKRPPSKAGLYIGLGVGGLVFVGGVVALILILNSNSSTANSGNPAGPGTDPKIGGLPVIPPFKADNRFVGIWHSDKPLIFSFQTVEFTADGKFHHSVNLKSQERPERHTTSYSLIGDTATVNFTRRITINGELIPSLTARMINDDEIEIQWLKSTERRQRVK
jgi:hypothetical protein